MTQRSMPLEGAQLIEVRAGVDVRVIGTDASTIHVSSQGFWGLTLERRGDVIRVSLGGTGEVRVPRGVPLQVHAGRSADIEGVTGVVQAYTGWNLTLNTTATLLQASAGGAMSLVCARLGSDLIKVSTGRDLRWQVAELTDIRLGIHDIGGRWEIAFGSGARALQLNSGGDVIIVTTQPYRVTSPNGIVGLVETPTPATGAP